MSSGIATISLDGIFGGFEITQNTSAILIGCLTVQTYIYYRDFFKDAHGIKILVALTWVLEVISYIIGARAIYTITVTDWGSFQALLTLLDGLSATLYVCATNLTLVKVFYLFRIYKLSGRRLWVTACLALSACVLGALYVGWIILGVKIQRNQAQVVSQYLWLFKLELAFGVVTDVFIAIATAVYLRKGTFVQVDGPLQLSTHVIRWTIHTGAIAIVVSVVNLATFVSNPNPILCVGLVSVLSKVYSNCLLASLDGRGSVQPFAEMSSSRLENASRSHGGGNIVGTLRNFLGNGLDILAKSVRGSSENQEPDMPLHSPDSHGGHRHQIGNITRSTSLATTSVAGPVSIQRLPPPPLPQPSSPTNSMSELAIAADTPLTPNRRYEPSDPSSSLTRRETVNSSYTAADSLPSYRSQPLTHRMTSISQVVESRLSTSSITEVPREEHSLPGPPQTDQVQSLGRWPTNSSMRTYTTLPGYKSPTAGSVMGQ